jgi:hypothetical protein
MSPIEAEYVYAYILELYREKVTPDTTNYEKSEFLCKLLP